LAFTERQLIAAIRRRAGTSRFPRSPARILAGIGDDCAVLRLPSRHDLLITTDFTIEGIHFRREWHSPDSAGHRCLARGLSDVAAIGGQPLAAFLSLALPRNTSPLWTQGFLGGLLRLARQFRVTLAGGDVAESLRGVVADVAVLGMVPQGTAVLRSGAKPGDKLYVTGRLGASAMTLQALRHKGKKVAQARLYRSHFFPQPRVAVGSFLRRRALASAMIDLSDGLSTDLRHICEESAVGALVQAARVPCSPGADLQQALHGGEDYELLFAAPQGARIPALIAGVRVTRIGEVLAGKGRWLLDERGRRLRLEPHGWQHFASGE